MTWVIFICLFGEDDIVALLCWHGLSRPTMSGYPCTLTFDCPASFSGSGGSQAVRQGNSSEPDCDHQPGERTNTSQQLAGHQQPT